MDQLKKLIEQLNLETSLTLDEIPKIDLYMDQVIQLFENKFSETKRNEDEKILTKTMINNYAKGKLIFPIKNKKYSREHLILISLIYQLKGALSINDIKNLLEGINKRIIKEDVDLDSFYSSYLTIIEKDVRDIKEDLNGKINEVEEEMGKRKEENSDYLQQILMISSLAHMSNLYRKIAEKLIDQVLVDKEGKRQK